MTWAKGPGGTVLIPATDPGFLLDLMFLDSVVFEDETDWDALEVERANLAPWSDEWLAVEDRLIKQWKHRDTQPEFFAIPLARDVLDVEVEIGEKAAKCLVWGSQSPPLVLSAQAVNLLTVSRSS